MFLASQIAAILGLLLAFGVSQSVVNNVQGILEGTNATSTQAVIPQQTQPPIQSSGTINNMETTSTPQTAGSAPAVPSPTYRIQTFNWNTAPYIANKIYKIIPPGATSWNEDSYFDIGIQCFTPDGKQTNNTDNIVPVTITATDSTQNKSYNAAPDVRTGKGNFVSYEYNFYSVGLHTITITCGDATAVLTATAQ